jgi:hypothetical protein
MLLKSSFDFNSFNFKMVLMIFDLGNIRLMIFSTLTSNWGCAKN